MRHPINDEYCYTLLFKDDKVRIVGDEHDKKYIRDATYMMQYT